MSRAVNLSRAAISLTGDANGNVGVGITPNAWAGGNTALQMAGPSMWGSSGVSHWSTNTYFDGTNYKYIASNYVSDYYQLNGAHVFRTAASGTAGANVTSLTEAMRIDANGNVGIGTFSPNINTNGTVLHINNSTASRASIIHMTNAESGSAAADGLIVGKWSDGTNYFYDYDNNSIVFGTNNADRVRIDTSGNLGITNGSLVISTAGKGIDFAASSNASGAQSELLDDYERGTWTASSGSSGYACSGTGYYVKIGRMVFASVYLQQTYSGSSGVNVAVMGLPYASDGYHSVFCGYYANGTNGTQGGYTESGSAYMITNASYNTGTNVGVMLTTVYQATS